MTERNIIATASGTVSNGRSSTSNLSYEDGKSRADLVPGNTYTVTATYNENNKYTQSVAVGELEMLKCNTTTTITGSSSVTVGDSLTLTIKIKENNGNTYLSRGYVTVYDGQTIVQQNYAITGTSTNITFTPNATGTHTLKAVFTDSGVEYNSSTSSNFTVTVVKKSSSLNQSLSSITLNIGNSTTISGTLVVSGGTVRNQTIKLVNYAGTTLQTVTTNSSGAYSLTYSPQNLVDHGHYITVVYDGTSTQESASKKVHVTLNSNTSLSFRDSINYHSYSSKSVTGTLLDYANNGIAGKNISAKVDGNTVSTFSTDVDGVFNYSYPLSNSNIYADNLNFNFSASSPYNSSNRDLKIDVHYEEVHFTKILFVQTSTSPSTYSLIPVDDTTYQRYKKGNMTVQEVLSQLNDTVIAPSFYDTTSQTTTKSKTLGNPSNTSYLCYCIDDNNIFNSFLCELHIEPSTHEVYDMTWYYGTEAVKRLHSKYSLSKSSISSIWDSNNWAVYEKQAGESKTNPVFDPTVTKYYDICDTDNWDYWVYKDSGNESQPDRSPTFCKNSHEADLGVRYRVVWQIPIQSDGSKEYYFKLHDVGKYTRMGLSRRTDDGWSYFYTRRNELGLGAVDGEHTYHLYVEDNKVWVASDGQSKAIVHPIDPSRVYYFTLYPIAEGVKLKEFYEVTKSGTVQLGQRYIHRLNNKPLDPNKTYRVTLSSGNRYVYIAVTRKNSDGTFYVNDSWRRSFISFDLTINDVPTFEIYNTGVDWMIRANGKSLKSTGYDSNYDQYGYYIYLYPTATNSILHSIVEEVGHNNIVEDLHANLSIEGSTTSVLNVNPTILTEYDNEIDDDETVTIELAEIWYEYGKDTANTWTDSMFTNPNLFQHASGWGPVVRSNTDHRNIILKGLPFEGDFEITVEIYVPRAVSWSFGFSKYTLNISNVFYVSNSNLNGSEPIEDIFENVSENNPAKITLRRDGKTFSIRYGDNEYTYTAPTIETVYFYVDGGDVRLYTLKSNAKMSVIESTPTFLNYLNITEDNWIAIPNPSQSLTKTENVWNSDGTLTLGQRQNNLYPISSKTIGTKYHFYVYQTGNLQLGVLSYDGTTVSDKYILETNTTFSTLKLNKINEYIISYESDGVYLCYNDEKQLLTSATSGNYMDIYTSSYLREDLIKITMQN